jgi:hypothetical protein
MKITKFRFEVIGAIYLMMGAYHDNQASEHFQDFIRVKGKVQDNKELTKYEFAVVTSCLQAVDGTTSHSIAQWYIMQPFGKEE